MKRAPLAHGRATSTLPRAPTVSATRRRRSGLGAPLGDGLVERGLSLVVLQPQLPLAVEQQPDVDEGEDEQPEEQGEQHGAVELGVQVAPGHRGVLVERAPPVDAEVDDRHVDEGDQAGDGGPLGPHLGRGRQPPDGQVAQEEQEQQRGAGQAGVPGPVDAPRRPAPEHPGDEREPGEEDADLRRGAGEAVEREAPRALPQVEEGAERRSPRRRGRRARPTGRGRT